MNKFKLIFFCATLFFPLLLLGQDKNQDKYAASAGAVIIGEPV